MARPLRFRYAPGRWSEGRVRSEVFGPLDANLGAESRRPWFRAPEGFEARRFDVDNGDLALFCWRTDRGGAFWLGNTETPSSLWKTDKYGFDEVPEVVEEWAQREFLAAFHEEAPWFESFPTLSWFFLPVFMSKDGRTSTRAFFREHAAGFPEADPADAAGFYESFLETGVLDAHRETMAGKLGTSRAVDRTRMAAAMGEFDAAFLLSEAGYDLTPEIPVKTGHSLDFRADGPGSEGVLVEVTRPLPPERRSANGPVAAVRDTAETKTSGQLEAHGGGVVLFVDCSSFDDADWAVLRRERPAVRHRPAVVFRLRPTGEADWYTKGSVPLDLEGA